MPLTKEGGIIDILPSGAGAMPSRAVHCSLRS
jgi:hypothetical protein